MRTQIDQFESAVATELVKKYKDVLYESDISLEEGLFFVNGDLEQYAKQAHLFVNFFEASKKELEAAYQAGDIEKTATKIHALKGNAKSIGAIDLYYTARRMEQRCYRNDILYIKTILSHLEFS